MQVLTRDDLRSIAPSILARSPYHTMTPRYRAAYTADVVDSLERNGFFPVRAAQSRTKAEDRRSFVKHQISFRRLQDLDAGLATEVPEVVLTNSFDGTTAYKLNAGLFRLVCLNGLVIPTGELGGVAVRHSGDDIDKRIIDATHSVLSESLKALDLVAEWKQVTMNPEHQQEMAVRASWLKPNAAINPAHLLNPRRDEDRRDSNGNRNLWVTTNILEEALIKGGVRGINLRGRYIRTKPVKQIDQDMRIHKGIWELAQEYSEN